MSNKRGDLAHSYNLGVSLGIAEAIASMNKERQNVYIGLTNARTAAEALRLPTKDVLECIAFAAGSTPLSEIQQRLVALRATYQASL